MQSTRRGSFSVHRSEKTPGSKYSSTSGLSPLGHLSFEYPGSVGAGPRQVATEQGPQEAIFKELSRHEPRNQQAKSMELSSHGSCYSTGNNQAGDQAGITQLSWQLSSR